MSQDYNLYPIGRKYIRETDLQKDIFAEDYKTEEIKKIDEKENIFSFKVFLPNSKSNPAEGDFDIVFQPSGFYSVLDIGTTDEQVVSHLQKLARELNLVLEDCQTGDFYYPDMSIKKEFNLSLKPSQLSNQYYFYYKDYLKIQLNAKEIMDLFQDKYKVKIHFRHGQVFDFSLSKDLKERPLFIFELGNIAKTLYAYCNDYGNEKLLEEFKDVVDKLHHHYHFEIGKGIQILSK